MTAIPKQMFRGVLRRKRLAVAACVLALGMAAVRCSPYTSADNPISASPDCGHTYTSSSAVQPGGAF